MAKIEYEGKTYDFDWNSIILMAILAPAIGFLVYYISDYHWLEGITADITVWSLNLMTGLNNYVEYIPTATEAPYVMYIESMDGGYLPRIGLVKLCTGIQAIAIFAGIIVALPHSKDESTSHDIVKRKILALFWTTLLFYVINIARMWLQLYLYHRGFEWEDIHYSISAASSFISVAAILIVHKITPEFIISILWISDQIKVYMQAKKEMGAIIEEDDLAIQEQSDEVGTIQENATRNS